MMTTMQLLYVEWEDASVKFGWRDSDDVKSLRKSQYLVCCVGWVVDDTKDYLIMTEGLVPGHGMYSSLHKIPKKYIKRQRRITQKNLPQMENRS